MQFPHTPSAREQDERARARRRYLAVAAAAVVAIVLLVFITGALKRRAVGEAEEAELSRLAQKSEAAAAIVESYFDERFAALGNVAAELLAAPDARDRAIEAMLEDDEAVLSAAYEIGDARSYAERTGGEIVVSRDVPDMQTATRPWISDVYKIMDEGAMDRYMGAALAAILNPYASPYASHPSPPKPSTAVIIGIPLPAQGEQLGTVWLELSMTELKDICNETLDRYDYGNYARTTLFSHEDEPALEPDENAPVKLADALRRLRDGSSSAEGIDMGGWGERHFASARTVRIGDTGQTWYLTVHSSYDRLIGPIEEPYELAFFIGIFLILLAAATAGILARKRELAARPKPMPDPEAGTEKPVAPPDPAFLEQTKGLRQQRFACRLLCVLFFIPSLLFINGSDKKFEKAMAEEDIAGMQAAVAGMWPPAIVGVLLGLAILWANFAL